MHSEAFYLGKVVEPYSGEPSSQPLRFESKWLTTHAVCLGMTGSGKTGLGITILEEAGLQGLPAIVIDPKGDMGNLVLMAPREDSYNFEAWVDPTEAARNGISLKDYAAKVAKQWSEGQRSAGIDEARIETFLKTVDVQIYTPANDAGVPLSILSTFEAPSKEFIADTGAFRDRVMSLVSSILGLLGINADPIKSREHILISAIVDRAWRNGENLDLARLIQLIQKPEFQVLGALDIETFFPEKERLALAINLNNLLASPGFQAWMHGEPLDIASLLYTKTGKPKISILSIVHLSDSERMFFVTLLLNQIVAWMRTQGGTSSLKALVYMDEIFGYFPPVAMPPSKMPMLTLLKQARAYGLGIVLATQNPVDLDYKGLANCGTWFIGKLQTERDKERLCEGLRMASNGEFDGATMTQLLNTLKARYFIMRSIYEQAPVMFTTRWTMSYLRGPLTLNFLKTLGSTEHSTAMPTPQLNVNPVAEISDRNQLPKDIEQLFLRSPLNKNTGNYSLKILGHARVHFVDSKLKIDSWKDTHYLAPYDQDSRRVLWREGEVFNVDSENLEREPYPQRQYEKIDFNLRAAKSFSDFKRDFAEYLYQNETLEVFKFSELNLISLPEESEEDFRKRIQKALSEQVQARKEKIRASYSRKLDTLQTKVQRALQKKEQRKSRVYWRMFETMVSFFSALVGAFVGKGMTKGTITQTGTTIGRAGKVGKDHQEAASAEENYQIANEELQKVQHEMEKELELVAKIPSLEELKLEKILVKPRKSDLDVERIAVVWV